LNIVNSFFKRAVFLMISLSISSAVLIYFFQQHLFYTSLADEIKATLEKKISKYQYNVNLIPKKLIENDAQSFIDKLGFIRIEIYDANQSEIYHFVSKNIKDKQELQQIYLHDAFALHNFPKTNKMTYNFFEIKPGHQFLQVFYPIYKSNELLGYIEGIYHVGSTLIEKFQRDVIAIIITVLLTIVLFSLLIFPLIYFAYKKLNSHRLDLLSSNIIMINTLGNAIAQRDSDTGEHNYRVTLYAIKLAEKISLDKENIQKLIKGAFLHDIGKIGISDNILLKKDKLTQDEYSEMKKHVLIGVELVKDCSWLEDSIDVILNHHEKFDGSGYPYKVKGLNIPKIARIFTIVDVFDALTSKRPYKKAFSYEDSINFIKNGRGTHFDSNLVDIFIQISKELYNSTNSKSKEQLKKELDGLIKKYFFD